MKRLRDCLGQRQTLAIALSGGVDSLTLACVASSIPDLEFILVHALSPAVPGSATERVRCYAQRYRWNLIETDAGEYQDPDYHANPVNRCYFCKKNLYRRIREVLNEQGMQRAHMEIASGTNLDDLGDFRPGLLAAEEQAVIHPFVEAMISKAGIREIAARLGLRDIAGLPAQPCLASRVETGIAIEARDLAFIERAETSLADLFGNAVEDLRCRITAQGVRIELDAPVLHTMQLRVKEKLDVLLRRLCAEEGRHYAGCRGYRKGASFLRSGPTGAGEQ